jgi:hypothetical protein
LPLSIFSLLRKNGCLSGSTNLHSRGLKRFFLALVFQDGKIIARLIESIQTKTAFRHEGRPIAVACPGIPSAFGWQLTLDEGE